MKNIRLLFILVFLKQSTIQAQDKNLLYFGLNVGAKFASKDYALRYTGAYQYELETALDNSTTYNTVYQLLGNQNFYFSEYNLNYKYTPAFNFGGFIGYRVNPNFTASLDVNFSTLKVNTSYTLVVEDASNTTSQSQYVTGYIYGAESRFNGKFNLDYIFDGDKARFILGAQGIFIAWRMDQLIAELNGTEIISMYSKFATTNNYSKKTSGQGWGYGINTGIQFKINENMTGQLLYQPYFSKVEYFMTKSQIESASYYEKPDGKLEHDLTFKIFWN